jgi:plastocyanin
MRRFKNPGLFALALVAALSLALVACGDDDDDDDDTANGGDDETATSDATEDGGDGGGEVTIADNSFTPASLTISVGDTVTWTWTGSNPHSVVGTSDNAVDLIDSEQQTGSGTYEVTFDEAGEYEYQCGVHGSSMSGTIIVE